MGWKVLGVVCVVVALCGLAMALYCTSPACSEEWKEWGGVWGFVVVAAGAAGAVASFDMTGGDRRGGL